MINPVRTATFSYTPPVIVGAIGIYSLHRATELEGTGAERAFIIGLVLLFAALGTVLRLLLHERTGRERELEDDVAELRRRVCHLDREMEQVRQDVDSRLAVQEWLVAFDRAEVHSGRPWITLAGRDDDG